MYSRSTPLSTLASKEIHYSRRKIHRRSGFNGILVSGFVASRFLFGFSFSLSLVHSLPGSFYPFIPMPFPSNDEYIDASFLPSVSTMIYSTPEFVAFRSNDRSLDGHATNAISFSEVNT